MAIQSAVTCSEAKDGGLFVSWQLMECLLVWVESSWRFKISATTSWPGVTGRDNKLDLLLLLFVGCLTSQQHDGVNLRDRSAQTIVRAAKLRQKLQQTLYLTESQYTDTRPTSPSADSVTPGAWQGIHCSASF